MKDNTKKQKQILVERYARSEEGIKMLNIYEAFTINMLASYMGKKNKCWPKQKELARVCRMSERQLQRALKSLEDKKIIKIKRTKSKNIYSFNEFWLQESDKFLTKVHAADAFLEAPVSRPDTPNSRLLLIYNNKKNNRADLKKWKGCAETAEQASSLLQDYERRKH